MKGIEAKLCRQLRYLHEIERKVTRKTCLKSKIKDPKHTYRDSVSKVLNVRLKQIDHTYHYLKISFIGSTRRFYKTTKRRLTKNRTIGTMVRPMVYKQRISSDR